MLFGVLEDNVNWDAAQWEGWLYFVNYIAASRQWERPEQLRAIELTPVRRLCFNHDRFGALRWPKKFAIINKETLAVRNLQSNVARVVDYIICNNSSTIGGIESRFPGAIELLQPLLEHRILLLQSMPS
jgi:hypothetical protein